MNTRKKEKSDYSAITKILMCFFCVFLFSAVCFARNEVAEKFKAANKNNILGTWKMIYQTVSPLFRDNSLFYADFQIFEFSQDGYFKNLSSKKVIDPEKAKRILERMPKGTTYSFINEGVVNIKRSEGDFYRVMISIAQEDLDEPIRQNAPLIEKGQLVASYVDANNNMYMQRYFTRIDWEIQ